MNEPAQNSAVDLDVEPFQRFVERVGEKLSLATIDSYLERNGRIERRNRLRLCLRILVLATCVLIAIGAILTLGFLSTKDRILLIGVLSLFSLGLVGFWCMALANGKQLKFARELRAAIATEPARIGDSLSRIARLSPFVLFLRSFRTEQHPRHSELDQNDREAIDEIIGEGFIKETKAQRDHQKMRVQLALKNRYGTLAQQHALIGAVCRHAPVVFLNNLFVDATHDPAAGGPNEIVELPVLGDGWQGAFQSIAPMALLTVVFAEEWSRSLIEEVRFLAANNHRFVVVSGSHSDQVSTQSALKHWHVDRREVLQFEELTHLVRNLAMAPRPGHRGG